MLDWSAEAERKVLRYTHVSIATRDADRAGRWYQALFGLEEVPAPKFGNKVRWFRVGNMQLHMYEGSEEPGCMQHFGLFVDNFEEVYRKALEMGAFHQARRHYLFITPANEVQLYLRDSEGNNVEVNWPDASTLPISITQAAIRRDDQVAQSELTRSARLFMTTEPVS